MAWVTNSVWTVKGMKLFTRYNRINLFVMTLLFLLSGICYYFLISYLLVHELDEALDDYRYRVERYVDKNHALPPIGNMDDTRVDYVSVPASEHGTFVTTVVITDRIEKRSHNYRQLSYTIPVLNRNYRVTLAKPIEGVKLLIRTVVGITVAMLMIIIATALILNQVILSRLWKPFYDSLSAMKSFKLGKKSLPVFPESNIDEFVFMNSLLEETVTRAEAEYQALKEFTENASHEIQTPLAIIRSKLDLVIQEEGLSEKQTQALTSAYSGIKRMTKLNQSLLLLAKIENRQFVTTAPLNLREKIEEKLEQFQEFWQNNGIVWNSDLQTAHINSNPELIDILLSNLIGNAGRHNIEGGHIFVKLTPEELIVENSGPQAPLDSGKLFRRFYKEAQHSQHNGLGLSIVKQICDQLHIDIQYDFYEGRHQFRLKWN
jgi:signal transduction histidine kinase